MTRVESEDDPVLVVHSDAVAACQRSLERLEPIALGPFNIDLSPDGSRMSVGARTQASNELWALENVLSVLSGGR